MISKYSLTIVFISMILLATTTHIYAQGTPKVESWETKPIETWEKEDVDIILGRSPWSQVIQDRNVDRTIIGTLVTPTSISYTLRSALVVRYALVRRRQLAESYDSMDDKSKAAFNQKNRTLVECPACEKYYVVAISCNSNLLRDPGLMTSRGQNIFLSNDKGEKRKLANFTPSSTRGTDAIFYFPRFDEKGIPLITTANKTFTFNFEYRSDDDTPIKLLERIVFDVGGISRAGQVVF